jgi:hypothetical protein
VLGDPSPADAWMPYEVPGLTHKRSGEELGPVRPLPAAPADPNFATVARAA